MLPAENGARALRLFGGVGVESIAAVVTDIRMPGMDGHAPGPTLPKPFSPDDLLAAVQQLLNSTPDSGHVH